MISIQSTYFFLSQQTYVYCIVFWDLLLDDLKYDPAQVNQSCDIVLNPAADVKTFPSRKRVIPKVEDESGEEFCILTIGIKNCVFEVFFLCCLCACVHLYHRY